MKQSASRKTPSDPVSAVKARPAPRRLSDMAYETLSMAIRERKLRSGETIVEHYLAESLGLSRTPLRQALQRLELEGQLVKHGGRSFQVRHVSMGEYLQSLKVREMLEPEAAELAVDRLQDADINNARTELVALDNMHPYNVIAHWKADDALHHLFIDNCGNQVLARSLHALRVTTKLFEIDRLADRLEPDSREHYEILDALQARDKKAARRAVAQHIRSLIRFAIATAA
jgi:DNA-binding GntR family transcriptional regulator